MPEALRYSSARFATERGSRSYPCIVAGSRMSQRKIKVGSLKNGSITAVDASGIRTMSDSLMPFQPEIEDPSNILPVSNTLSSTV